jgi:hypothetical protein
LREPEKVFESVLSLNYLARKIKAARLASGGIVIEQAKKKFKIDENH